MHKVLPFVFYALFSGLGHWNSNSTIEPKLALCSLSDCMNREFFFGLARRWFAMDRFLCVFSQGFKEGGGGLYMDSFRLYLLLSWL